MLGQPVREGLVERTEAAAAVEDDHAGHSARLRRAVRQAESRLGNGKIVVDLVRAFGPRTSDGKSVPLSAP